MADQTLSPDAPTAQAFIAGQGAFPIQTNPAAGMVPPVADVPMVDTAGGPEAPKAQPSAVPEPVVTPAVPDALPQEAPTPEVTPEVTTEDDTDVESLKIEDVVDPTIIEALKQQAGISNEPMWVKILGAISRGASIGNAEYNKPGGGAAMSQSYDAAKQNALNTLGTLYGQFNRYKSEILSKRRETRKATATQEAALKKEEFKQASLAIRQTLDDARAISGAVVLPVPPTAKQILGDPESVSVWLDQSNQIIQQRRQALYVVDKQIPLFEKIAKSGVQDPKLVRKSFEDMLTGNGIDAAERHSLYGSTGMLLESLAAESLRGRETVNKERLARVTNIKSMMKDREDRAARLSQALSEGNLQKASTELRLLAGQKLHVAQALAQNQMQLSMFSAAKAADEETLGGMPFSDETIQNLQEDAITYQMIQGDLEQLENYGTALYTQRFNAQRPEVALYDATREAKKALIANWPEAQQAMNMGMLDVFIQSHASDPRVVAYRRQILQRSVLSTPPNSGQAMTDYIDQSRAKNLSKDALFGTFMQPETAPTGQTPEAP